MKRAIDKVVIAKPGYSRHVLWLEPPGRPNRWHISLRPTRKRPPRVAAAPARLNVIAFEGRTMIVANIYLGGRAVGQTPLYLRRVNPGLVTIKARRAGYRPATQTVRLVSDRAHKIVFRLSRRAH